MSIKNPVFTNLKLKCPDILTMLSSFKECSKINTIKIRWRLSQTSLEVSGAAVSHCYYATRFFLSTRVTLDRPNVASRIQRSL